MPLIIIIIIIGFLLSLGFNLGSFAFNNIGLIFTVIGVAFIALVSAAFIGSIIWSIYCKLFKNKCK